ncbi:apolipoprotein L2-like [Sinocyclocheilus rhinocerous]|uniref:apolipoprotein L2-like n=1 Tax=Sinocyclocheilus rhinocerous TaxID=307959 RepID=UPI0007B9175D|nr:PREDICTED: apolipoprotein L2-like [Sinocyclocheilus rhinocerous]
MDIRAQLEERLTEYVKDTLSYIETVRVFCDQEPTWTSERKDEREKLRDISENQQEEEEEKKEKLSAVLKDTLEGLKKLEPFLDAVEKLAATSSHVFNEQIFLLQGKSPESVQSVIADARIDAPLLIHFKRNAESFFQPLLQNVNILVFQLNSYYVLKTEQLCSRIRQNSVECADIYKYKMGQPSVELILNASENAMNQMLDHLNQLCEIRMNQHTRLAFLFQDDAQKFIDVFGERRSKMWQFLSHLEQTAVKLDLMKKGASISTVAGSSVGIVGGVLSLIGIFLAPFTVGASLFVTLAGAGLGGISALDSIVTGITETKVNQHQEHNAQSYLNSYKDDMIKIEDCLKEAANSEGPLVKPTAVDAKTILTNTGEGLKEFLNVADAAAAIRVYKSEKVTAAATEITMQDLNTASDVPQVATFLSRTRLLANVKTLRIVKVVRGISGLVNLFFIGLDGYFIAEEIKSLAKGSESEVSKLMRSRAALWKSELEAWEKMHDSLSIGIKTISESKHTLEKPFLP